MTVITVDDEGPALRRINKLVMEDDRLVLLESANSAQMAFQKLQFRTADLLFLDIQLKDATAFDVLSKLNPPFNGKVVFVTAYDEFAIKAFEIGAVDYLLKPFNKKRFENCIDKIEKSRTSINAMKILAILKGEGDVLKIQEGKRTHFLNASDILYIQSESYYTRFFMADKSEKLLRITLKRTESLLPENFQRIGKSIVINLIKVLETRQLKSGLEFKLENGMLFKSSSKYLNQ